jgi:hypothetical protein
MAYQKWEYCVVKFGHSGLGNAVFVSFADGNTLKYKGDEQELARVLTQLGSEGWETTGGAGSSQGVFLVWVMKRPT